MIVDVRCSSQYSSTEDTTGSEVSQRLQTLQKQKKQIDSQIEILRQKEDILRDVLVAYASNDKFDFGAGLDRFDEKKIETRVKREELEEEAAVLEKKIKEAGAKNTPNVYGITRSIYPSLALTNPETVKVNLEAETECEVTLIITTRTSAFYSTNASHGGRNVYPTLYPPRRFVRQRINPQHPLPSPHLQFLRRRLDKRLPRNLHSPSLRNNRHPPTYALDSRLSLPRDEYLRPE